MSGNIVDDILAPFTAAVAQAARNKEKNSLMADTLGRVTKITVDNASTEIETGRLLQTASGLSDRILFWTGMFSSMTSVGKGVVLAGLVYQFVSNLYKADNNKLETEARLQALSQELQKMQRDTRNLVSLVLILGGSLGISIIYNLKKSNTTRAKSRSRKRRRSTHRSSSLNAKDVLVSLRRLKRANAL